MAALPVEILQGVYLGILTGLLPTLVAFSLGFGFKYITGVSIPGFGVVVLSLALAGVNGGLLALTDQTITQSATGPVIITAILVILMLSLYAHAKGDALGATFPRRFTLSALRAQTLSNDVVEFVGGRGQVTLEIVGDIADMEAYPPLPDEIRTSIKAETWKLPADLGLEELEARFRERLRTEFDLADAAVTIDAQGKATVAAAPPASALSKRIPAGKRAVSVDALVPTGLARGDIVTLHTDEATIQGTLVSARSSGKSDPKPVATDGGTAVEPPQPSGGAPDATTTGGDGRVTVAVSRSDARTLLTTTTAYVVVQPRGTSREFELLSLLRRSGKRFRKFTLAAGAPLVGETVGSAGLRDTHGVGVLAVRSDGTWRYVPTQEQPLAAGDELFVVGPREGLDTVAGVVS